MDLHIDHLDCRYRTPASAEDASILQKRLDLIASSSLARVWEEGAGYDAKEAIYFVERVDVDLTLDASSEDHRVARAWALELHKGITRTLQYGGRGVVVFATRGDFLASFIGDLLRGSAWDKWYYREFALLAGKSTTQAAAAALTAEPDAGRDALILLTRRDDLDLLLATLGDRDVDLLLERCLLPHSQRFVLPNTYARWADALRGLLSTHRLLLTNNLSRDVTSLYLRFLLERAGLGPDVNLARFIHELLQLRNTIIALQDSNGFLRLVASEAWDRAFSGIVDSGQRRFAFELARELGGHQLTALLRELQTTSPAQTLSISTRYGGLFLLAPAAVELGLDGFLRDSPYPDPPGAAKVNLLTFLIGLQCLGGRNAKHVSRDAALPLFAGLAAAPTMSYLERYAASLTNEMHEKVHDLFRAHRGETSNWRANSSLTGGEAVDQPSWFSLSPDIELGGWDRALEPISREVMRLFTARLGAFAESSSAYVSRNFLECNANVEVTSERIVVRFLTCPLQMVLRMAWFEHMETALPWLENRRLEFRFE